MARLQNGSEKEVSIKKNSNANSGETRRTQRACDRCRFKKSKCNGQQPCRTCRTSDRICIYSAPRRRDARNWYCGMQETVDEAIQRLYRACKNANVFPGTLPEAPDGVATTQDIIRGLGLMPMPPPSGTEDIHTPFSNLQEEDSKKVKDEASSTAASPTYSSKSVPNFPTISSMNRSSMSGSNMQSAAGFYSSQPSQSASPTVVDTYTQLNEAIDLYHRQSLSSSSGLVCPQHHESGSYQFQQPLPHPTNSEIPADPILYDFLNYDSVSNVDWSTVNGLQPFPVGLEGVNPSQSCQWVEPTMFDTV